MERAMVYDVNYTILNISRLNGIWSFKRRN